MLSTALGTMWDILLGILLTLGILAGFVVWVTILAVVWAVVTRFVSEYQKTSKELEDAEEGPQYNF